MKIIKSLILIFLVFSFNTKSYSQKITAGFYSGVNFSDIHGNDYSGKWKNVPGPDQGLSFDFALNKTFGIKTGLDISSIYYRHLSYINYPIDIYYSLSSVAPRPGVFYIPDYYYPYFESINFSFLTLPAQLTLKIPSKPALNLSAGLYYSFLLDNEIENYYGQSPKINNDFGYIYSAGLTYPISEKFNASFNIRYLTGRQEFFKNSEYLHGATSYTLGFGYTGFLKSKNDKNPKQKGDTINENIFLIYRGGLNASWNSGKYFPEKYSAKSGVSLGILINFRMSDIASFQTGLTFERLGYSLRDSSDLFHVYTGDNTPGYYVDTKTSVDYILIPALLNLNIGKPGRFYINTGPYLALNLNGFCRGKAFNSYNSNGRYSLYESTVSDDLEKVINDFDTGWIFGAGTTFTLFNKCNLDLGLRYLAGFRDVYVETDTNFRTGEPILKNSALSLLIGLRVPVYRR